MSPLVFDLFLWYFTEKGTTGHIIEPNQVTKKQKPESSMCVSWHRLNNHDAKNIYLIHDQGQVSPNQTLKIPFVQNLIIKALSKSVCLTDLVVMMIIYPLYTADVRGVSRLILFLFLSFAWSPIFVQCNVYLQSLIFKYKIVFLKKKLCLNFFY